MNGSQCIVKALKKHGITTVFGYPGGAIMPLYDALYDGGIEHVLCRHEQAAAIAAIGYARSTGKIGVCIATSGPGATNLVTGLADALLDSIPIIAITGQVAQPLIGTDAFQEIDVLGLSLACTKQSFLVEKIDDLPQILAEAFFYASNARPGPVLIDIPKDIQLEACHVEPFTLPICSLPAIARDDLKHAAEMISAAQKPILYIGGGVGMAKAVETLRTFVSVTGIPCVSTLKGLGAADINHSGYLGLLGMHGSKAGNYLVQECDLLIAIGVRFDDRVTGKLNTFAAKAKVIHIDIDPAEIGKLRQPHIALRGDINEILPFLQRPLQIEPWCQKVVKMRTKYAARYDHPGSLIYAPLLLKQLSECKPVNAIVVTDVGQHQMWAAQHMRFHHPQNFITSSGLGTMGFGLPAAIGAQMARPNDMVICISGDGSFMMNVQELTTIKRKKLPVKIVLIDNQRLGMVRQWQELFFDGRYSETTLTDNPDFLTLARAFDIPGQKITEKHQVKDALSALLNSEGAYLLHVAINELENVWPLVPPGAGNETMLEKVS